MESVGRRRNKKNARALNIAWGICSWIARRYAPFHGILALRQQSGLSVAEFNFVLKMVLKFCWPSTVEALRTYAPLQPFVKEEWIRDVYMPKVKGMMHKRAQWTCPELGSVPLVNYDFALLQKLRPLQETLSRPFSLEWYLWTCRVH